MKNKTASLCRGMAKAIWWVGGIASFFLSIEAGRYAGDDTLNWLKCAYLLFAVLIVGLFFFALGEIIRQLNDQINLSLIVNAGGAPVACAKCKNVYDSSTGKCPYCPPGEADSPAEKIVQTFCPKCEFAYDLREDNCPECGEKTGPTWICAVCGTAIPSSRKECKICEACAVKK